VKYKLLFATWNQEKAAWLKAGFQSLEINSSPLDKNKIPDIEETGKTCIENASLKINASGVIPNSIIIGEDSGLFIDALHGFPGVKTVRWAEGNDDDRAKLILEKMRNVPSEKRTAKFVSGISLLFPDGALKSFEGIMEGSISESMLGETGHGYGRIFMLENGKPIADSNSSIVKENDHRYKAMQLAKSEILKWIENNK